eukprot:12232718-Heterocapsa_arctica.AAC.1
MNSEPQYLWTTGVIIKEFTTLPDTEQMRQEDTEVIATETAQKSLHIWICYKNRGQCICWMGNVVP